MILGIMIGSSLDGIDCSLCDVYPSSGELSFSFVHTQSLALDQNWKQKILTLRDTAVGEDTGKISDQAFARDLGNQFKQELHLGESIPKPELVVFHGPTLRHIPEEQLSLQLGCGKTLNALLQIPVLTQLRQSDLELGGTGAPLAPIADHYFFRQYDSCINLGGIVNISFEENGKRKGFDLCGGNQALDHFSKIWGKDFDADGKIAAQGKVNQQVLKHLNNWQYFEKRPPKSLSNRQVFEHYIMPLEKGNVAIEDILRTLVEHLALQLISQVQSQRSILLTGGGAKNHFLIERLKHLSPDKDWVVPQEELVDHKEGLLLCLMGYLHQKNQINVLSSCTGASKDSIGGQLFNKYHS